MRLILLKLWSCKIICKIFPFWYYVTKKCSVRSVNSLQRIFCRRNWSTRSSKNQIYNCQSYLGQWAEPPQILELRIMLPYIKMTIPAFQFAIFNSASFIDEEKRWQWLVSLNTLIVNRQTLATATASEQWSDL